MKPLPSLKIIFSSVIIALLIFFLIPEKTNPPQPPAPLTETDLLQKAQQSTLNLQIPNNQGTAFLFQNNLVITNKHVIENQELPIKATFSNGEQILLNNPSIDPLHDIAILEIQNNKTYPHLTINTAPLTKKQSAFSLANSLNTDQLNFHSGQITNPNTDTKIKSHFTENFYTELIETNLPLKVGSSGGPLLNQNAEIIGMNIAVAENIDNLSYALSAKTISEAIQLYKKHGSIKRPSLGARFKTLSLQEAQAISPALTQGALITNGKYLSQQAIFPNSTASKIGLQENDVILQINNQPINQSNQLDQAIQNLQINQKIIITIWRNGKTTQLTGTLEGS